MKYAINNELLVTETAYNNAELLADDVFSKTFRFFITLLKSTYTRAYKLFSDLLCGVFTGCWPKNLYKDVYEDYLFYKEHCNGKMSYRIWCRYGAMLLDVDRYARSGDTQTDNELELKQEENIEEQVITKDLVPFIIKVKSFKPYSV